MLHPYILKYILILNFTKYFFFSFKLKLVTEQELLLEPIKLKIGKARVFLKKLKIFNVTEEDAPHVHPDGQQKLTQWAHFQPYANLSASYAGSSCSHESNKIDTPLPSFSRPIPKPPLYESDPKTSHVTKIPLSKYRKICSEALGTSATQWRFFQVCENPYSFLLGSCLSIQLSFELG